MPTLPLHGINSDSAGNYQLIDEESFGRILSTDCQRIEADSDRQDQNVWKIQLFKKFKYENVIKLKNKPCPSL
jgi:hypothetical protein